MAHQVVLHLKALLDRCIVDLVSLVDGAGGWFHFLDLVDAGSDGRDLVSGKIRDFLLDLRQQLLGSWPG